MERVDIELAVELEEIGFCQKELCDKAYIWPCCETSFNYGCLQDTINLINQGISFVEAPYLEEVAEWFRNEKNIHILPYIEGEVCDEYSPLYKLNIINNITLLPKLDFMEFSSYEDALQKGVKEAIKILKENDR